MTNDWDFYPLRVDDKPASIFVDLGIANHAPVSALPWLAYISLQMNQPEGNGLSSRSEYEKLCEIEDALEKSLVNEQTGYVGRCTTNSCRDFYFYTAEDKDWEKRVAACMQNFTDYKYDTGTQEDPEWECYSTFLAPSPYDRGRIENRRVCINLERNGEKFVEPRDIDHVACFEMEEKAHSFADTIKKRGFIVKGITPPNENNGTYGVEFKREDIPSFHGIDDIVMPLYELALEHDGFYDGWGTEVRD